ncbi:MAG: BrnT family toxin [Bifidobacteriaceae bacterium]|nr:BrnT family toxin [Bifidobacteriaceae bacterium]
MGGRGGEVSDSAPISAALQFEWDPAKSVSNKNKHGIDFEEAKALWQDAKRMTVDAGFTGPEPRQVTIGMLDGKMYLAVTTQRGQATRIISVRRCRQEEVDRYAEEP